MINKRYEVLSINFAFNIGDFFKIVDLKYGDTIYVLQKTHITESKRIFPVKAESFEMSREMFQMLSKDGVFKRSRKRVLYYKNDLLERQ